MTPIVGKAIINNQFAQKIIPTNIASCSYLTKKEFNQLENEISSLAHVTQEEQVKKIK